MGNISYTMENISYTMENLGITVHIVLGGGGGSNKPNLVII